MERSDDLGPAGRSLDMRNADLSGLAPEAAALARNMRVTLVPDDGPGDPLEAVVDFLQAVKRRSDARKELEAKAESDGEA